MRIDIQVLLLFSIQIYWCSSSNCDVTICGSIGDANTTVEHIADLNMILYPKLKNLVHQDYFRIFQVNLYRKCQFWIDDGQCVLRDCEVEDCPINDVPKGIREIDFNQISSHRVVRINSEGNTLDKTCVASEEQSVALGKLDSTLDASQSDLITDWNRHDDNDDKQFCEVSDESAENMIHVDLLKNVEKYTGYQGPSAGRVWDSIYRENCFDSDPRRSIYTMAYSPVDTQTCKEKRVFYRMLSGLQTSISLQLCYHHLLSNFKSASSYFSPQRFSTHVWGPNLTEFKRRFDPANEPQALSRLRNLFFLYTIQLRALAKAAPLLRQYTYYTGDTIVDKDTREMVLDILDLIEKNGNVFNEKQLFLADYPEMVQLKEDFRLRFRNITRIMDCVGCDKCRLWGKLQIQGAGTALKILFTDNIYTINPDGSVVEGPHFQLRRTEIVALVNAFAKLASSLNYLHEFQEMIRKEG